MASYKDAENFRLSRLFPAVESYPVARTSEATRNYNCYAYAAGDTQRPWCCLPFLPRGVYWPPGAPRQENDVWSVLAGFGTLGYELCESGELEVGVEKIAIYVDASDVPQHAAIQRADGTWQSKLGSDIDVSHTLASLEHHTDGRESVYGRANYFVRRPRAAS